MTRPDDWVTLIDARIERAKALGWQSYQHGTLWLVHDPNGVYTGMGESEYQAYNDLMADADLWDEISALLV